MIIKNAYIHTITNGDIKNGYIKLLLNKIVEIGEMDKLNLEESDAEIIDAEGNDVYPGFIDAHTHLGLFADGENYENEDANEVSDPITPNLRVIDAINPLDRCFKDALSAGITTVIVSPGSANPIAGQIAAIKTCGKRIDDMIVKEPLAMKFSMGENPKSVYSESSQFPKTRMAVSALIRESLYKARRYMEDKNKAKESKSDYDLPDYDAKLEALIPVLEGKVCAHFHAHRADDIFTAIRISKEFNLNYVIVHGTEGHIIADELLKENTYVISGPFIGDRSKSEIRELSVNSPVIMSDNGIKVAITTDHPETPIQYLLLCVSLAVGKGMPVDKALKAITIDAAKICGIDDAVGSIEVGKDADLLLFDKDPLTIGAEPKMVMLNGKIVLKK